MGRLRSFHAANKFEVWYNEVLQASLHPRNLTGVDNQQTVVGFVDHRLDDRGLMGIALEIANCALNQR